MAQQILPDSDPDVAAWLTAHQDALALRARYDLAAAEYVTVLELLKQCDVDAYAARARLEQRDAVASVDGRGWPGQNFLGWRVHELARVVPFEDGLPQWPAE